jgi:hypothetical protein
VPITDEDGEEEGNQAESEMGDDERDDDHVPETSEDEDVKDDFPDDDDMLEEDDFDVRDQSLIVILKVDKAKLRAVLRQGLPTPASEDKSGGSPQQQKGGDTQSNDDVAMKDVDAMERTPSKHRTTTATTRQLTPEPTKAEVSPALPLTPSSRMATGPLAFRRSPEKPPPMNPRPAIDVSLKH